MTQSRAPGGEPYSPEDIEKIKAIAEETKKILEWIEAEGIGDEEGKP